MRMGYKHYGIFWLAVAACLPLAALGARTPDPSFNDMINNPFKKTDNAELSCPASKYKDQGAACKQCKTTVDKWKKKAKEVAKKAGAAESTAVGLGSALSGSSIFDAVNNATSFGSDSKNTGAGRESMEARSRNATAAKAEFEKCQSEIKESCKGLEGEDKKSAETVLQACHDAGSASEKHGQKTKDAGMGMNDLMKAAQLAQAGMGMIPKPQGGESGDLSGTSPTPASTLAENAGPQVSKMSGASTPGSSTVGFGANVGQKVAAAGGPGSAGGSGLSGASFASDEVFGNNGSSSTGGAPATADAGAGGGGSGGLSGSGGGGGNSSGSSRAAEIAAVTEGTSFEMNGAGSRPMSSFKSAKSDGEAANEGLPLEPASLEEFTGEREPASEEEQAEDDSLLSDGESIFARVRSKYGLLKGAGRI